MIRTDREYQESLKRLEEGRRAIKAQRAELEGMGFGPEEVKRGLDPMRTFCIQIEEDVEYYERLKQGDIGEVAKLHNIGMKLIALRIALGVTQRELASRMGVHESQVSRDERDEYHGITMYRASRIFDALGMRMRIELEPLPTPEPAPAPGDRDAEARPPAAP